MRDKKKKALADAKRKLVNYKYKFESSTESKKFRKARAELLEIPDPKEKAFHAIGITTSKKKVAA